MNLRFVLSEDAHCAKVAAVMKVGEGERVAGGGVALRTRKAEAAENISQRAVRVMQSYCGDQLFKLKFR